MVKLVLERMTIFKTILLSCLIRQANFLLCLQLIALDALAIGLICHKIPTRHLQKIITTILTVNRMFMDHKSNRLSPVYLAGRRIPLAV
jgi:hypothetical protein